MILEDLIELAEEYQGLGWSVQRQLQDVLDGEPVEDKNPNAMKLAEAFLRRAYNAGIEIPVDLADALNVSTT